jgi:hypothetical protein
VSILRQYLPEQGSDSPWQDERKKQLERIGALRGRAVITYAARMMPPPGIPLPLAMNFADILPFNDLLDDLTGSGVDVILETPGGDGVVARDMVERLREKFQKVSFIIPGWAKSAGTIMAMGGDEILMGPGSALGPIDAQLVFEGKQFSADALLEGMKDIQDTTLARGRLNPAFIPMLQRISPGDLQHARNALDFAKVTVAEWLAKYKFKDWSVTNDEKEARAKEIADELCRHSKWKMHGRSLRLPDLKAMRLDVVDYSREPELSDAIQRYYILVRLLLDSGNAFKIIETTQAKFISRFNVIQTGAPAPVAASSVQAEVGCPTCGRKTRLQLNFEPGQPVDPQAVPYPQGRDELPCSNCGTELNLKPIRELAEKQFGRPLVV